MMYKLLYLWLMAIGLPASILAQDISSRKAALKEELATLKAQEEKIVAALELVSLEQVRADLKKTGLPKLETGEELIEHTAMMLVYDEAHEQAKWVAHIVTPDILNGNVSRTNDFRTDSKVKTGSAEEKDYFLKSLKADGTTYEYDGFGYDRGHLAPSADFRWSQEALSESYFYSNMSPQVADFNRGRWAELEGVMRSYIYHNPNTQLYVVTGPVLKDDLPKIERSINKVSIPEQYFKVILDLNQQKGIAFLMPNAKCEYPIESYAVAIDKVEELTGIDFYPSIPEDLEREIEKQVNPISWLPEKEKDDVPAISAPTLPPNTFNTVQAKLYMDRSKVVKVCGTVVSTKLSRKGNVFMNLDKKFPNQHFTVFIRESDIANFSYEPQVELMGAKICVKGKVVEFGGTPTMYVEHEKAVEFYKE